MSIKEDVESLLNFYQEAKEEITGIRKPVKKSVADMASPIFEIIVEDLKEVLRRNKKEDKGG